MTDVRSEWPHIGGNELRDYAIEHSNCLAPAAEEIRSRTIEYQNMVMPATLAQFLAFLIGITGSKRVLEIGTFTGYLTTYLLKALPADGRIVSIERDSNRFQIANEFLDDYRLNLLLGDSREILDQLGDFDMIVVDGDKVDYVTQFDLVLDHLSPSGFAVFDNTIFAGTVWHTPYLSDAAALIDFNQRIARDDRLDVVMIPAWDGLTVVKRTKYPSKQSRCIQG